MKNILCVLLVLLLPLTGHTQNATALGRAVNELAREDVMKHATLSVCVYNLDKQSQVYAYNS